MGAMEPTARPMEEAVNDSKQVMPMNRTNLHQLAESACLNHMNRCRA